MTSIKIFDSLMLTLVHRPNIQERIFAEIKKAAGETGRMSLVHRPHMPYTWAVLLEILRMALPLPMAFTHQTLEDTIVQGYKLPNQTPVGNLNIFFSFLKYNMKQFVAAKVVVVEGT